MTDKEETYELLIIVFLFAIISTITVTSCRSDAAQIHSLSDDYPTIKIAASMGENYKSGYMSLIGNLGYLVDKNQDSTQVLVISQRIAPGTIVNYNPFGVLIVGDNDENEHIIVATTPNEIYTSVEIKDLSDLSIHFGYIKRMIEQWYIGMSGLGGGKVIKWESKKYITEISKD